MATASEKKKAGSAKDRDGLQSDVNASGGSAAPLTRRRGPVGQAWSGAWHALRNG